MKMDEMMQEEYKFVDNETRKRERQRSDLISKKLGELLLQGYKMLNSTCDKCECILMQKKQDPLYCVGCQDKDVLALNQDHNLKPELIQEPIKDLVKEETKILRSELLEEPLIKSSFEDNIQVIRGKINWATDQLKNSNSISYNLELLELIKKASEAIESLKKI